MPRIVDKEAKRRQIVQAAMIVFARTGVYSAKMADIALAAGVGKGTIYEYFRSKDEVFAAAMEMLHEGMEGEVARRIEGLEKPEEKLRAVVESFVHVTQHSSDFIEIMLEFWAEGIRQHRQAIDMKGMYERYRQMLAAFFEEGVRSGDFRPLDATLVASTILGALDGLMLQWFLDKELFSLTAAAEELIEMTFSGIRA